MKEKRNPGRIAIVGGPKGKEPENFCAPCGVCRQVMAEFCDPETFRIILMNGAGEIREYLLKELLPLGLQGKALGNLSRRKKKRKGTIRKMTYRDVLKRVDHTLLKQPSTWEQIREICDDAVKFGTASVCIPPSFVKQASEYLGEKMPVCTVIGFPNGYNTTAVKVFETKEALKDGAEEIDMVINIGWVENGTVR